MLETGIIFLFMNVKRFKRSFFCSIVLYSIFYEIKCLVSANLNTLSRVGRVTGDRGTSLA